MRTMLDANTIKATALGVMPAAMVAAEAELSELQRAQADVCAKIQLDRDIASGVHQSALRLISQDDRRAAQVRLDRLNAEAARLDRAAASVRERIRSCSAENAHAVQAVLVPMRKVAAEQVLSSIAQLTAAITALNSTGLCLKEAGISAVFLPTPLLAGMSIIARSIMEAKSPEMEKR